MSVHMPSRGGVRGGQDQFAWEEVKVDKDRENYLGEEIDWNHHHCRPYAGIRH